MVLHRVTKHCVGKLSDPYHYYLVTVSSCRWSLVPSKKPRRFQSLPLFFLGLFLGKGGFRSSRPTQPRTRSSLLTRDSFVPGPGRVGSRRTGARSGKKAVAADPRPLCFNWRPRSVACFPRVGPGRAAPSGSRHRRDRPTWPATHTCARGSTRTTPAGASVLPGPSRSHPAHSREPRGRQGGHFTVPGTRPAPAPTRAGRYRGRRIPESGRGCLDKRTLDLPPQLRVLVAGGRWQGHVASAAELGCNVQERPASRAGKHPSLPWAPFPSVSILLAEP